jgi:hypothetical protein
MPTMPKTRTLARQAMRGLGERGVTTRIPEEVRAAVLAYADEARAGGETWAGIAKQVGLSATALQRWSRGRRGRKREREENPARLLPVRVSSEPAFEVTAGGTGSGLTLSTPHGERLEGLGVAEAVALLRALR